MPRHRFVLATGLLILAGLCWLWWDSMFHRAMMLRFTAGNNVHYVGVDGGKVVHARVKDVLATGPTVPRGFKFIRDGLGNIDPQYQVFVIECNLGTSRITNVSGHHVKLTSVMLTHIVGWTVLTFWIYRRDKWLRYVSEPPPI